MSSNKYQIALIIWSTWYVTAKATCLVNDPNLNLPTTFPCQWLDGRIPFAFDFFSINSNRLLEMIREAHRIIENSTGSCLTFHEYNPVLLAAYPKYYYYLYYTYSGVLEDCCTAGNDDLDARRVVLISVSCKEPIEIAHVTLHMLGLTHKRMEPFASSSVAAVLSPNNCQKHEKLTPIKPTVHQNDTAMRGSNLNYDGE